MNMKNKKSWLTIRYDEHDMVNMIKVEDKIKSMKRSKGSRGSKEIRRKINLTQKDAKARGQKKTRQQTRRFLM